jgi:hypothetical protein
MEGVAVLHVRISLLATDPRRTEDAISYLLQDARKVVEDQPGNQGMSMLTNIELGVVIAESFWVSGDAMRETEKTVAPLREEAARRGEGTVSTERFQVANFLRARHSPWRRGAPGQGRYRSQEDRRSHHRLRGRDPAVAH